jgi:hypothetical protein
MSLTSALALGLCCLSRCGAWNTTQYQHRVHYIASLNLVTELFVEVFALRNVSKDRFTIKTSRDDTEIFEEGRRVLVGEEHNVILPGGSHMPSIAMQGQLYSLDGRRYLFRCGRWGRWGRCGGCERWGVHSPKQPRVYSPSSSTLSTPARIGKLAYFCFD